MPVASKFPGALDDLQVDVLSEIDAATGVTDPDFEPSGEGHHAKNHNLANAAINALQELLKEGLPGDVLIGDDEGVPVWAEGAIPATAFGAVEDDFYTDGVVVNGSTTFTSASAKFTAADVGKTVVIGKGGPSSSQDHHTTIKEVKSPSEVVLNNTAQRSQEKCRWLISRAGDQTAPVQAAVDECEKRGGGTVVLNGVGFLVSQITLGNRVKIVGLGRRGTCLHQVHQSNKPLVVTNYTENDSAGSCGVEHIWLDGARARQSDVTTTLSAKYTAGDATLKLTNAASFLPVGMVIVGNTRIHYTRKNGNTLEGLTAGLEGTTDATSESGTTVTQKGHCALYMIRQPFNTGGTYEEAFDSHHTVRTVLVKNFRGDGLHNWAQSEVRCDDVWARNCDEYSFRPSFDTFLANCISDTCGRSGFYTFGASSGGSNNKSFFSGGVTPEAGHGFFFEGKPSFDNEGSKAWMGCIAQDNKAYGFYGRNADLLNVSGAASSNSTSSKGTYTGVGLDGVRRSIFHVVCTEREGANPTQQNALHLVSTGRKCVGNTIALKHYRSGATATVGTAIKEGSDLLGGNDIRINGMGGTVTPTYAAEYTPDPYEATIHAVKALTGNVTLNAPTNAHLGCPLTLILLQDGTGGRTVTWNAAYDSSKILVNTGAGALTILNFVFDGTIWRPQTDADQANKAGWTYLDNGLSTCSLNDPQEATTTLGPEAGKPLYTKCKVLKTTDFSTVRVAVSQAASEQIANGYVAVYNKAGERLGVSADVGKTKFRATGEQEIGLTADAGKSLVVAGGSDEFVYIQILVGTQGTTPVQFRAATATSSSPNFAMAAKGKTLRCGTLGSGISAAPASFKPAELAAAAGPILIGA